MNAIGMAAGLTTALLWTITALCFESAGRRLGSLTVNVLRLVVAALLFFALALARSGALFPPGLNFENVRDLSISGVVGFVLGDLMLFQAFVLIGARLSMLIYATVPTMTAIAGYVFLGESLGPQSILGMFVTAVGIVLTILGGRKPETTATMSKRRNGIALALGGSAGQAAGLLLGKTGSIGLDAFSATQVRVLAGLVGFLLVAFVLRRLTGSFAPLSALLPRGDRSVRFALAMLAIGAILGPFLGVSLGLWSAQLLPAGIASTLMSLEPILLVPAAIVIFHERVSRLEWLGTLVALVGVALLAL